MSQTIPAPPPGLELNHVPNKTLAEAVDWLKAELGMDLTPRFLRNATDQGKLTCRIVAQRRCYSTAELYRFVVTLPTATARKEHRAS